LHYIGKHNPAKAVRLADDKIITKKFLTQRGIPVPTTYAVIKNRAELAQFDFFSLPHTTFIIKPAR
jgi:glutathione synthase/RimK-type ligase-like ATP-grasp enzyme